MAKSPRTSRSPERDSSAPPIVPELPNAVLDELPPLAKDYIGALRERLAQLESEKDNLESEKKRLESENKKLRAALAQNSSNSNRPPSSDSPFRRRTPCQNPKKPGGKPGHLGHRRPKLAPTHTEHVHPVACEKCGNTDLRDPVVCGEHQVIELPPLSVLVLQYLLYKSTCPACRTVTKARLPAQAQTAYGPRLTAFLAMMMGPDGISRRALRRLCRSVFGLPISLGGLQKVDTRGSKAIEPHHEAITEVVQNAPAANIDETTFSRQRALDWLWVMATTSAVLFRLLPTRSKKAFEELIGPWKGFLTADAYGVYLKWAHGRQSCGAHPLRRAKALAESDDPEIAAFGRRMRSELRQLLRMKRAPPTVGQWMAWRARYRHLIGSHLSRKDDAGKLARHLDRESDTLWAFLERPELDLEGTNNYGERMIRPGVQWRKRRQGTRNETGVKRVERGLTLHQTCRLRDQSVFHVLVDAVTALFHKVAPDLSWIKLPTPAKGADPAGQPAVSPTA